MMFDNKSSFDDWSQSEVGVLCSQGDHLMFTRSQGISSHGITPTLHGYILSLVDTLWNAGSYRQPPEQEGNPMT